MTDVRDFFAVLPKGRVQCPDSAWLALEPGVSGRAEHFELNPIRRRRSGKHWSILSKEEELTTANAEFKLLNTFLHQ